MEFRTDQNKGLSHSFRLSDATEFVTYNKFLGYDSNNQELYTEVTVPKKKLLLIGGEAKAGAGVQFQMSFIQFFRVYLTEFIPQVTYLIGKSAGQVESLESFFVQRITDALESFNPNIRVISGAINFDTRERKTLYFTVDYEYLLEPNSATRLVSFINIG